MSKGYRPYLPDQDLLLPPSLQEWLPEGHLVYFVSDVVNQLDLSAVHAVYGEEKRGQPPYDPRLMIKLLVYGYCTGVFSSRRESLADLGAVAPDRRVFLVRELSKLHEQQVLGTAAEVNA